MVAVLLLSTAFCKEPSTMQQKISLRDSFLSQLTELQLTSSALSNQYFCLLLATLLFFGRWFYQGLDLAPEAVFAGCGRERSWRVDYITKLTYLNEYNLDRRHVLNEIYVS